MASSGFTNFDLDVVDIIEEAYEMVGKEVRGGYDIRTARRSLDLLMKEWANRGINFWTLVEDATPVPAGTGTATLSTSTIDVLDVVWRTGVGSTLNDRMMTRMGVSEWAEIAFKNQPGDPTRYWVNRLKTPEIKLWPIPTVDGLLVYWKLRQIEDTGNFTNNMDVPWRFLPAMTAGLGYYLAIKTPGADNRIPILQQEYERQFGLAADEDRERASLFLRPVPY